MDQISDQMNLERDMNLVQVALRCTGLNSVQLILVELNHDLEPRLYMEVRPV